MTSASQAARWRRVPLLSWLICMMAAAFALLWGAARPAQALQFPDVAGDEWYAPYAAYVSDNGLMTGYGAGDPAPFAPYAQVSRATAATVLYRFATGDSGEGGTVSHFADVPTGMWYTKAIEWCRENGIAGGYGDGTYFGPNDPVTREALATMLYRFAKLYGYDTAGADLSGYPDMDEVSSWALGPLSWCVAEGIISGDDTTQPPLLKPLNPATRAHLAKMLCVLCRDVFGGQGAKTNIAAAEVSVMLEAGQNPRYSGSEIRPEVVVRLAGEVLSPTSDYDLSYADNVNAGTATITVTGKGSYAGEAVATFTIEPAPVSGLSLILLTDRLSYTGSPVVPEVYQVAGAGRVFAEGEYALTCENNLLVGVATARVELTGNYSGSAELPFYIYPVSLGAAHVELSCDFYEADGAAKCPEVTVTYNGAVVSPELYEVSYQNNVAAGTATAIVSGTTSYTVGTDALQTPSFSGTGGYCDSASANFEIVDGATPWALLYSDGTLALQRGIAADDALGGEAAVVARYTGFEDVAFRLSQVPWHAERASITRVTTADAIAPVSVANWFTGCTNLVSADLSGLDGSRLASMCSTFAGCTSLTSLKVGALDTSKVTDMSWCFGDWVHGGCTSLEWLDLSALSTASIETMAGMFMGCSALYDLLPPVLASTTPDTVSISQMFFGCSSLTYLDLSGWDAGRVMFASSLFEGCTALKQVDVATWNTGMLLYADRAFAGCTNLPNLDLVCWTTKAPKANAYYGRSDLVASIEDIFEGCDNLGSLWIGGDWEWTDAQCPVGATVNGVLTKPADLENGATSQGGQTGSGEEGVAAPLPEDEGIALLAEVGAAGVADVEEALAAPACEEGVQAEAAAAEEPVAAEPAAEAATCDEAPVEQA